MSAILFALGALTMIVEFAIPRLIAPAYGNTLFSWTAIISVVLVAMTVGYYVGGKISENDGDTRRRILLFGSVSAIWSALIAIVGASIVDHLSFLDIVSGPLVTSLLFAFVPTFLNAAIVPMVISISPEPAGSASGNCFSISTVGSIVGVIITGYLLLPIFGISGTLLTGSALFFIALCVSQARLLGLVGLVAIALIFLFISQRILPNGVLVDHSNGYHRIKITEPMKGTRYIMMDNTVEGVAKMGEVYSYLPGVTKLVASLDSLESVLVIGGGAFSTPRYFKHQFPTARVDVIELDPDVQDYAREYLELGDNLTIHIGDGRNVLGSLDEKYDLIFNDAFRGYKNIPSHMTTLEFNDLIKQKLNPGGIYAINVRGYPNGSYLSASLIKTLSMGFEYIVKTGGNESNTIVLASDSNRGIGSELIVDTKDGIILTDNRAPTEMLIVADLVRNKFGF